MDLKKNIERIVFVINERCPYCQIIKDGSYKTYRKSILTGEGEIHEKCTCNEADILKKIKSKCCVCGKEFGHGRPIERYCERGNWCKDCNNKVRVILRKKFNKI